MARIRDHVRGHPAPAPDPAPMATTPVRQDDATPDTDLEQALVRVLGRLARDQRQLHLRTVMVEGWLRAETEEQAQEGQRVDEQLAGLSARLDALTQRLARL